jgi:hypothetical protein
MNEAINGDGLTKAEMKQRKIKVVEGSRGGIEFHAPTYADTIVQILQERGFLEDEHVNAGLDYLQLKNCVYGFLNIKTMSGILNLGEVTANAGKGYAESAFYIISREAGKLSLKLVEKALEEEADATLDIIMVVNAYRSAFIRVFDGLQLAKQKIREEIENELAN